MCNLYKLYFGSLRYEGLEIESIHVWYSNIILTTNGDPDYKPEKIINSSSPSASAAQLHSQSVAVSVLSIKIPPFWPVDLEVWIVEAQFSIHNIANQRTRFSHVIAALAPEIAMEVQDMFLSLRKTIHTTCSEPS